MLSKLERNLEAFHWLPLDKWNPDTILTGTEVAGKRNCKVCDEWVARADDETHVDFHIRQRKAMLAAMKAARDAERALEKAMLQGERQPVIKSEFYDTPCETCGHPIKRTGKRGRPPKIHAECKSEG